MSDAQWFYLQGGEQFGPVSIAVLRDMASLGSLEPTDLVWRQGSPAWSAVREIPELAGAQFRSTRDPNKVAVRPHGSAGKHLPVYTNRFWVAIGGGGVILGLLALAMLSKSIVPRKPKSATAAAEEAMRDVMRSFEESRQDMDRKHGIKIPGLR